MYGPSGGQLLAGVAFLIGVGLAAGILLVKTWPLIGACVHWVVNLIW